MIESLHSLVLQISISVDLWPIPVCRCNGTRTMLTLTARNSKNWRNKFAQRWANCTQWNRSFLSQFSHASRVDYFVVRSRSRSGTEPRGIRSVHSHGSDACAHTHPMSYLKGIEHASHTHTHAHTHTHTPAPDGERSMGLITERFVHTHVCSHGDTQHTVCTLQTSFTSSVKSVALKLWAWGCVHWECDNADENESNAFVMAGRSEWGSFE